MKRVINFFVVLESIFIFVLIIGIFIKITARQSVSPINRDSISFDRTGGLKYFYEPNKDSVEGDLEDPKIKAEYTINNDTLNERYDYSRNNSRSTYRIITLGDSYTYGLYVDTRYNWSEVLEDKLNSSLKCQGVNKFEVINLGVHGYDTMYTAERFKKRGVKYNPDLVVWLFVDMFRVNELQIPLANEYDKTLNKGDDYYLPWRTARNEVLDRLGAKGILDYQRKALSLFDSYYEGPLLVVPSWRIKKNSPEDKLLVDYSSKRKSSYYTTVNQQLEDNKMLFENDPHPNRDGHRFIADQIFDQLLKADLVDCKSGN